MAIHNSDPNVDTVAIASFLNTTKNGTFPNYEAIYFVLGKGTSTLDGFVSILGLSPFSISI